MRLTAARSNAVGEGLLQDSYRLSPTNSNSGLRRTTVLKTAAIVLSAFPSQPSIAPTRRSEAKKNLLRVRHKAVIGAICVLENAYDAPRVIYAEGMGLNRAWNVDYGEDPRRAS